MEIILDSPFVEISFDKSQRKLLAVWKDQTATMSNDQYKELFEQIAGLLELHKPDHWLGDIRKFGFFVIPELQEWIATAIMPRFIQAGLKKMAMLASENFIAQLSIEQTTDEMEKNSQEASPLQVRYFDNDQAAQDWFLGKTV
ncbi:MAG TPA: hypothetical protein DCM08_03805 [Microscillaceae bacterium]|nr:hypothetical protein [Microscillaceae bacterium]